MRAVIGFIFIAVASIAIGVALAGGIRDKVGLLEEAWAGVVTKETGKGNSEPPAAERSDAIRVARECLATKGAVTETFHDRKGNLTKVTCTALVKKEN